MKFYNLSFHSSISLYTNVDDEVEPVNRRPCYCSRCGSQFALMGWDQPHRVVLEQRHRTEFGDLVFGPFRDFIVSDRFLLAFEKAGLRGVEKIWPPVEVVRIKPKSRAHLRPPVYRLIEPVFSKTRPDSIRSKMKWQDEPCPECLGGFLYYFEGIYIDEKTWTGEDIFRPLGLGGYVFCTQRFREMCYSEEMRNAFLLPTESLRRDDTHLYLARQGRTQRR